MGKVKELKMDIQYIMNVLSAHGEQKAIEAFENVRNTLSPMSEQGDCKHGLNVRDYDPQTHVPMYVDTIDNVGQLRMIMSDLDDTIVREVQFVQRPNCEPDTRDKTELIDAVITQLMDDYYHGDQTVLVELLQKFPWEILKQSLPEDQWAEFDVNKSFEQAKRLAINEAKRKISQGKLFKSGEESPESEDFTDGDPETLFSLASLYAQFVDDDYNNACDALLDVLQEEFPDYL